MLTVFSAWLLFILGLIVGSFLNVFIVRHQTGLSIKGRSFCFTCGHTLLWHDLIPLVSFIVYGGRCRYCGARISFQYPLVEFIKGILFILVFLKLNPPFTVYYLLLTAYYLLTFTILLVISAYDIRHKIIPNVLVYFFIALSFAGIFIIHDSLFLIQNFVAGPLLALPFIALWFASGGKWVGLGDAKLALGMGWLLGLSLGFAALILAVWTGAVAGLFLIVLSQGVSGIRRLFPGLKRFTIKSEIPFAPFLILGTLFAFLLDISFTDIQLFMSF